MITSLSLEGLKPGMVQEVQPGPDGILGRADTGWTVLWDQYGNILRSGELANLSPDGGQLLTFDPYGDGTVYIGDFGGNPIAIGNGRY